MEKITIHISGRVVEPKDITIKVSKENLAETARAITTIIEKTYIGKEGVKDIMAAQEQIIKFLTIDQIP